MAKFDLIVRGGRVIDPASGIDGVHAVAVKDGKTSERCWYRQSSSVVGGCLR